MKVRQAAVLTALAAFLALPAIADPPSPSLQFGPPLYISGDFLRPYGLAIDDAHHRLLVADTGHHVFKWSPIPAAGGAASFTAVGFTAGRTDPAALADPQAIAADAEGNVYVVNVLGGEVRVFPWNGGMYGPPSTLCGTSGTSAAGVPIRMPRDIAVARDGAIYLLDSGNNRVLRAASRAATEWTVVSASWSLRNPYGLDVDAAGAIYVADTGNNRIVKLSGSAVTIIGRWGTGRGEFRYPRDVAVDQHGRLFVADALSHRVQLLASDGRNLLTLGRAQSFGLIEKLAIDSADRLFLVDSDHDRVVAWLGGGINAPFDIFVRDYTGDPGDEPSNRSFTISSPDILVRHAPDVDLAAAARDGLESVVFQQPRYGESNYVYVAVHNRGTQEVGESTVRLYVYDPRSPSRFPDNWSTSGIYLQFRGEGRSELQNALPVPPIAAGGVRIAGPFIWRPPAPASTIAHDGMLRLAVRVSADDDAPPVGDQTTMALDSNNVSERRVTVQLGPSAVGEQNTLLIPARYNDVATEIATDMLDTRARELTEWVRQTSWGEAALFIVRARPVVLPHDQAYYQSRENTPIVELVTDALTYLAPEDRALLDPAAARPITRVIVVTNADSPPRASGIPNDWATTGAFPYTAGGVTRYLTASVQSPSNGLPLWAHGVSHQFDMRDLYPREGVVFPRPYADGWDNMATPVNGVHPLIWSKELSTWVSTHGARIVYVPRPAAGTTWNNGGVPLPLHFQESASAGQNVAVAFGLTPGIRSMSDETAFYFVEARNVSSDAALPATGVLMYAAHSRIASGEGPVLIRDHVRGGGLADAVIPVGESEAVPDAGLTIGVGAGTNGADYNLGVTWTPPRDDYDLFLNMGDVEWESPDIWVDGAGNGFDTHNPPMAVHERAVQGTSNRIYARIFNTGPGTARDVEVAFLLSEPYHTVGDRASFNELRTIFIDEIGPRRDAPAYVFVPWEPRRIADTHTCVRVELRRPLNDREPSNDAAQQNLETTQSVHGSPYTPIEFPVSIRTDATTSGPVYFRVDGIPEEWTWSIRPPKVVLDPGAEATATLFLQPALTSPDCTRHRVFVTAWTPRGDTLVRLGGTTLQVDLRRRTEMWVKASAEACPQSTTDGKCFALHATGCTTPARPYQPIEVRFTPSGGAPVFQTAMTDDRGCFDDAYSVTAGDAWRIEADFAGTECDGAVHGENAVEVPLPPIDQRPARFPDALLCLQSLSATGGLTVANGTFEWKSNELTATGNAMTDGERTFVDGVTPAGATLRAIVSSGGLLEGVLVSSDAATTRAPQPSVPSCGTKSQLIELEGQVELTLDQRAERTSLKPKCMMKRTWSRLHASLAGSEISVEIKGDFDAIEGETGAGVHDAVIEFDAAQRHFTGTLIGLTTMSGTLEGTFMARSEDGHVMCGTYVMTRLEEVGRKSVWKMRLRAR